MAGAEHDVDALRAKLKSLGYLDAGVDRFVLAPARADRTPWQIAVRSSARLGVLAGLMLGLSGAVAVGVRVPGLLTGLHDTVVLATLLAVVLGAAVGLLSLVVILFATRAVSRSAGGAVIVRHLRAIALAAGALVGAVCLAYLTFLWRAMDAASSHRSWGETTVALGVAAVISVLLGHVTTTTAQAVMADQLPETNPMPRRRLSLRASAGIALAGLAAAAAVLVFAPAPPAEGAAPPKLTVVSSGARLLVFAVDGYDDSLAARYLTDLDARLSRGPTVNMPRQSDDPAREWTTIATGQPVARHGVTALEVRRVAGLQGQLPTSGWPQWANAAATAADLVRLTRPTINSGAIRREKTFWEVAAQAGLRTVAVNWWTSWPARDEDGIVLTERAVLRLQSGGDLAGEIVPAQVYERLKHDWGGLSARAMALAELATASGLQPGAGSPDGDSHDALSPAVTSALREAALVDAQQLVLFEGAASNEVDLATVYLPGLDILGTKLRALAGERASTAVLVESAEAVRRYYRWLAARVVAIADQHGALGLPSGHEGLVVLLVGHPGRSGANAPAVLGAWGTSGWPGPHDSLRGPVEITPSTIPGTLLDVAPTALHLLGVPLSRELPGQARWGVAPTRLGLPDEGGPAARASAPTPVATYGRRSVDRARVQGKAELDEEMRERMRSLGYVQ